MTETCSAAMKKLHMITVQAKSFASAKMITGMSLISHALILFVHFTFVRFLSGRQMWETAKTALTENFGN